MSGEAPEEGDKTFEPTQKRMDDARRKGEVPHSADLTTAMAYGGFLAAALSLGAGSLLALGASLSTLLAQASGLSEAAFGQDGAGGGQPLWGAVLGETARAAWPWFALPAGAALLSVLAQGAVVFAPTKLAPQSSRVSPLAQAKQKFGIDGLVEFLKGLLKLTIYAVVLGRAVWRATPRLLETAGQSPGVATAVLLDLAAGLLMELCLVAVALGVGDLVWQRLRFMRRQMMSRREVTDEMKESEGDPHVKGQRRQRAQAIAMNRMMADVDGAHVVIVNPTHYAVALRWDRAAGRAPTCVAKGVDEVARAIRERAALAGVPVRSDPPTARALHASVEIGAEVGRDDWRAVAAAIRFAERLRAKAARQ